MSRPFALFHATLSAALPCALLAASACAHPHLTPAGSADVAPSPFTTGHVREGRTEYRVTAWPAGDTVPRPVGSSTVERYLVEHDGQPAVLSVATFTTPRGSVIDSGLTMLGSLRPVWERSHQPTKTMSLDFAGARVTGQVTPTGASAPIVVDQTIAVPVYNSSDLELLMTSMPLATGYTTTVPTYVYEMGGLEVDSVRVVGETTVRVGDATRDVWEVAYADPVVTMTLWIDRRSREVVRREAVNRKSGAHFRTELLGA